MEHLNNKTALVTSATRGIGLACARKLAEDGAHVFLAARRPEAAREICREAEARGQRMTAVYFDAAKPETYAAMVEETAARAGNIHILVNNFGMGRPAEDLDLVSGSEEAFFSILEMNLGSVYRISRLVIPHMPAGGSIVNISSIGGLIPDVTRIGYGVSKAAVNNITRQIALQYARRNIRCNAVLPGLTATEAALKNIPAAYRERFIEHVPLGRMGTPEDIANAVAFLAGDGAAYITGQLLNVAGGYGLGLPQYREIMEAQKEKGDGTDGR